MQRKVNYLLDPVVIRMLAQTWLEPTQVSTGSRQYLYVLPQWHMRASPGETNSSVLLKKLYVANSVNFQRQKSIVAPRAQRPLPQSRDITSNISNRLKPWYCLSCGEDGHTKPQCEREPNPSLVVEKWKQLRGKTVGMVRPQTWSFKLDPVPVGGQTGTGTQIVSQKEAAQSHCVLNHQL